jgi:signal transduction histidine kinase
MPPNRKKKTRTKKEKAGSLSRPQAIKEFFLRVLTLQEEEKKRISRDLHDETGQMVIALGSLFNTIERELKVDHTQKALAIIEENRALIQKMAGRMKFMAFSLRPPALDILGLSAVLREYFAQCTASSAIRIEFKENLKDAKLGENLEIALYRIIQEAILNVLKHSGAESVKVELLISQNTIQALIEDNGKGFDLEKFSQQPEMAKMGLRGIGERVNILGGNFSIESASGKGTKLKITLPLEG